jgi:16S rRNA (cytosine967-C5)-methyltransferase
LKRSRNRTDEGGARRAAFDILLRVERGGAYASVLLERHESRQDDPREAALLHELVLGVLRRRAVLDELVARVSDRAPDRIDHEVRIALRIGAYGLFFLQRVPDFAAVDTAVELIKTGPSRGAASFANAVLRTLARQGPVLLPPPPEEGDVEGLARYHSHPPWWVGRLVKRVGWVRASAMLQRNNEPSPTVLRANLRRTTPDQLAARLLQEGIVTKPACFVPDALRVVSGPVGRSAALAEGAAWVQDEAAQLVTWMFERPLGPWVADLCAAPGGKTMQLAEWLGERGTVVATDRHPGRLRRLSANVRRVGAGERVVPVRADMASGPAPLRGPFDQVLLDAPCSGSGTLGRRPEIRWRLREEDLKLLASRQESLLAAAAELLAPGGSLVYSVCSIEPEEGEDVVARFLDRHRGFRRSDPRPALPAIAHGLVHADGSLRTSPAKEGLDGFYAVLLTRRPGIALGRAFPGGNR